MADMSGRNQLTPEAVMNTQPYCAIIDLILFARYAKKQIRFKHLSYVLVKNSTKKMSEKKKKEIEQMFSFNNPWRLMNQDLPPPNADGVTIIEYADYTPLTRTSWLSPDLFEEDKITSVNNLSNYLHNLKEMGLISTVPKQKKDKKTKIYYVITPKGEFYYFLVFSHEIIDQFKNIVSGCGTVITKKTAQKVMDFHNALWLLSINQRKKF